MACDYVVDSLTKECRKNMGSLLMFLCNVSVTPLQLSEKNNDWFIEQHEGKHSEQRHII